MSWTKCKEDNCNKQPNYNLSTELVPLYCVTHKKENMIDIKYFTLSSL